jgi:hypothetical protein
MGENRGKIPRRQERPLNERGGIKESAIIDGLPLAAFGMVRSLEGRKRGTTEGKPQLIGSTEAQGRKIKGDAHIIGAVLLMAY